MSDSDVNCLAEMGFSKERAQHALSVTKGQGVQAAIEWLFSHPEDSKGHTLGDSSSEESRDQGSTEQNTEISENVEKTVDNQTAGDGSSTSNPTQDQVLSLVCEECGKKLRSEAEVQVHAARSGHQRFAESSEEIKPLTEEEKKEQVEKLQRKLAERRKEKEEAEKQADILREKSRRKQGKEVIEARQKLEMEEVKRIAEERRREKLEEKRIRQKLREKIAEDRARHQSKQTTPAQQSQQIPTAAQPAVSSVLQEQPKDYDTCRIQFRLTNGSSMTANFKPADLFSSVYEYISMNRTDGHLPFTLMTTFPRKTFTDTEMCKTLKELGLVPSSVLVVSKT